MLTVGPRHSPHRRLGLYDRCSAKHSCVGNAINMVTGLLAGPLSRLLSGVFLCVLGGLGGSILGGLISGNSVGLGGTIPGGLLDNGINIHVFR